jgi:hypothetical protein
MRLLPLMEASRAFLCSRFVPHVQLSMSVLFYSVLPAQGTARLNCKDKIFLLWLHLSRICRIYALQVFLPLFFTLSFLMVYWRSGENHVKSCFGKKNHLLPCVFGACYFLERTSRCFTVAASSRVDSS